jgi:hypothetical protein
MKAVLRTNLTLTKHTCITPVAAAARSWRVEARSHAASPVVNATTATIG